MAIHDGTTRLGTATVSGLSWIFTAAVLSVGSHSFTARVENPASGVQSAASSPFVLAVQ